MPVRTRTAKTTPKAAPRKTVAADPYDSRKKLDAFAARANKKFGPGTVIPASEALYRADRMSTGALSFDVALDGGLPINQMSEVIGHESAGKTVFCLKLIADAQRRNPYHFTVWGSAETFDRSLAQMCGVDETRVELIETNIMEEMFELLLDAMEDRSCDLIVLDSYPALVSVAEDTKEVGDYSPGRGAQLMGQFMRKGTKASKRSLTDPDDRAFSGIIINQWREKIGVMYGDPRTTSGGKAKNFWMYLRMEIKREEWIANSRKERVGITMKITSIKMKGARPQRVGVCDFYFDDVPNVDEDTGELLGYDHRAGDYDVLKQVIDMGIYYDVITRSSGDKGSYVLPDGRSFQSKNKLIDTIRADDDLADDLSSQVRDIASKKGKAPVELLEPEEPDELAPRRRRRVSA